MILTPVGLGILLFEIALFDEIIDLVGRIRLRDIQKLRKLAYRRLMQGMDDLDGERLHGAQRALTLPNKLKYPAEKLQLKLVIHLEEILLQHTPSPPCEHFSLFYSKFSGL